MGIWLTATFGRAFGKQATATTMNKLHHKLHEPAAQSVHIVPQVQNALLSTKQGHWCKLHCDLWQGGGKFLQRKKNKNNRIGGSSVKGVAMPSSRIMAVTTCRERSEL
jgi:hypothetical protein